MTAKKQITQDPTSDDLNPDFLFSTTFTDLLVRIAKGEVDCQRLARITLANRGLDINGKWVGFYGIAEHKI